MAMTKPPLPHCRAGLRPSLLGHPQYGLARLVGRIGVARAEVEEIATPERPLALRAALVAEALRPADTTERWGEARARFEAGAVGAALAGVALVEAANERDEAAAIAVALKRAVAEPGRGALVRSTALWRAASRRALRFGVHADDSGGMPLAATPPAALLRLALRRPSPGETRYPLSLVKHPLLGSGWSGRWCAAPPRR